MRLVCIVAKILEQEPLHPVGRLVTFALSSVIHSSQYAFSLVSADHNRRGFATREIPAGMELVSGVIAVTTVMGLVGEIFSSHLCSFSFLRATVLICAPVC